MDYPNQTRLKLLGRVRTLDPSAHDTLQKLALNDKLQARTERAFLISIEAFDWNCPQYITPRFTHDQVEQHISSLQSTIAELEAKLEGLNHAD
jgi:hypothetical protein